MKTISIKLPDGLDQKLTSAAQRQHTTKSNMLRLAITSFLDNKNPAQTGSCLDLANDLAGCINAPEDLSSNPKYLQGFGK